MVGFIIETPLAQNDVGSTILHHLHHVHEVILLLLEELLVVFSICDVYVMLGLGLWGFEGTCEDTYLGINDLLNHLGVRDLFIDENTVD